MVERIRPSWDEIFMTTAVLASTRSSCKYLQTGSVLVRDKRIIATGYNGAPPGIENCLDKGCRKEVYNIDFEKKGSGTCRGTHAERNAMSNIAREDLENAILYSLVFPCSECAKDIVHNKVSEVVYSFIYKEPDSLTKELFAEAGTKLRSFKVDYEKIDKIIRNILSQEKIK